jgi:hypothetical protein
MLVFWGFGGFGLFLVDSEDKRFSTTWQRGLEVVLDSLFPVQLQLYPTIPSDAYLQEMNT